MEWDEASQFPSELIPKLAELGLLGVIFPEKYGGAGLGLHRVRDRPSRSCRAWTARSGIIVAAHNSLCTNHIYKFGTRGAAQEIRRAAGAGEKARLLVADRAGGRLRRRRHAHHRGAQGRRLGAQRLENVHHQRPLRRCLRGHGASPIKPKERTAFPRSSWRRATPGFRAGQKRKQAGHARQRHFRSDLQRLPRARRENLLGKEGEGFVNTLQVLDGGRISIAALALGMAQGAFEAAASYAKQRKQFGKADQRVPGHSVQAGRHGHGD